MRARCLLSCYDSDDSPGHCMLKSRFLSSEAAGEVSMTPPLPAAHDKIRALFLAPPGMLLSADGQGTPSSIHVTAAADQQSTLPLRACTCRRNYPAAA